MGRKFGVSFSAKRAFGISGAKNRISRQIGIPLTRSGRQRKFGRAAGCFIATVVYENTNSPEVIFLRRFRDKVLFHSILGRLFIDCYYCIGPCLAWFVKKIPFLKYIVKISLDNLIKLLKRF